MKWIFLSLLDAQMGSAERRRWLAGGGRRAGRDWWRGEAEQAEQGLNGRDLIGWQEGNAGWGEWVIGGEREGGGSFWGGGWNTRKSDEEIKEDRIETSDDVNLKQKNRDKREIEVRDWKETTEDEQMRSKWNTDTIQKETKKEKKMEVEQVMMWTSNTE